MESTYLSFLGSECILLKSMTSRGYIPVYLSFQLYNCSEYISLKPVDTKSKENLFLVSPVFKTPKNSAVRLLDYFDD